LFPDLFGKRLAARFDVDHGSSDGGAILLKAAEARLGVVETMAEHIHDGRQPGKVVHAAEELLAQRVYGLACGYADCNDAARLSRDPIHKALIDRDPVGSDDLGSQATLSRFENALGPRELLGMGLAFLDRIVERHRRRLRNKVQEVTIDLDVTDDPTHGGQQLSLFNGFYDTYCYLPLLGFVRFNDEPEQYLCAALLRPGKASCTDGARGMLRRIIRSVRSAFPGVCILVRLDGGFAAPKMLDFLERQKVRFVVGFPANAVLDRVAEPFLALQRRRAERSGKPARCYSHTFYRAQSWQDQRRVVFKAEVLPFEGRETKDNPRFVVTNLDALPRRIYELYCQRGEVENRIKELQDDMAIGRTSCPRFWANQFRVLMTAAAYALMQEIRLWSKRTALARAQVGTLRIQLLKIGAHVTTSVRRIVVHMPRAFPFLDHWQRIAAVAARAG
jgi:hypothetical protein